MEQLNVLVLAYYFPPMGLSGVQRITKFVKYLPDYGWHPHVIATGPTAYYAHDQSLLDELEGRDVTIHRTSGKDPNSLLKNRGTVRMPREVLRKMLNRASSTIFVPDNKKSWSRQALMMARDLVKEVDFDAILVSGPPFSPMMAGAVLSTETGIPLILDYRDLWYGNQFSFYPTPWHAHLHKQYEYDVLTHASKVVVTNRRIKERLIATYPQLAFDDVVIIPHGYDAADMQQHRTHTKRAAMRLTYAGIFYEFITPSYFFRAVKKVLKDRPDISLDLHFAGLLRDEHRKTVKKLGLQDIVHDHGYMSHADTVTLLQDSDALWMMVGYGKNADTVSSGKLYEYFGTRLPILASLPDGALRRDAERYGAAWITAPDDVDAIATCIIEMYDKWKKNALPHPDEQYVEGFERRMLTGELSRVLSRSLRIH